MPLTYEKYKKLQALLSDPNKDFPEDERARAQAAVEAYQQQYTEKAQPEAPATDGGFDQLASNPLAMKREGESPVVAVQPRAKAPALPSAPQPAEHPDAQRVLAQLDPSMSLPAQILSLQPATTHPGGDEEAESEWLRGPLDNPSGRLVFYEPHIRQVREELLEKPELFRALQVDIPMTPEGVMSIQEGDSTYQVYADYKWKQLGDEAAKAGKTAYRFSKAPYLTDGPNAELLTRSVTSLSKDPALKAKLAESVGPVMDGLRVFIGGYDDAANIGLGQRGAEASGLGWGGRLSPEDEAKVRGVSTEDYLKQAEAGGVPKFRSLREQNDMLEEAHPDLHTLGQLAGALAPTRALGVAWGGVTAPLWDWMMGQGSKGLIRGAASGAARAGAAGAVEQTAREGVEAASSYVETGDSGTTLGEAGKRVLGATAASVLPGLTGGALRGGASQLAESVRWGDRYDGAPGRVEAHGVEPKLFRGHVAPDVVQQAELRGRQEGGRSPLTVLASDLDEPLGNAARGRVAKAEQLRADTVAAHRASPEGGFTLPSGGLVRAALDELHELTSEIPKKGPRGVGKPRVENPVKDVLNANIEGASWRAGKHSVPISVEDARAWLSPEWLKKLGLDGPTAASHGVPLGTKAANDNARVTRRSAKGPDDLVWLTPRRYDSQHFDEVIEQLGRSSDPHMQKLHAAALDERAARGTGEYAAALNKHDAAIGEAKAEATRVGADRPRGVRKKVEAVGKSKGQHEATPALRAAAREAGGDAPEKLRGALVAEDLADLRARASLGARNPLASPWTLWGLTDKAILKGAYPAARMIERVPVGGAARAARAAGTATRNYMDGPDDERREQREKQAAQGYRERAEKAGGGQGPSKQTKGKRKRAPLWRRNREAER